MIQIFKKDNINLTTKKVGDEILFDVESVGRALGFTQEKNGKTYVKYERMRGYLDSHPVGKGDFFTKQQLLVLIDKSKNTGKAEFVQMLFDNNLIEEVAVCIQSRFELSFKETLEEVLRAMEIDAEFQKPMFGGEYRIDFYIPQYNLAVEYDEEHHKWQKEEDITREEKIKAELNCRFIRLDYRNSDAYNAGLVAREIMRGNK